jgi:hypothetical protein
VSNKMEHHHSEVLEYRCACGSGHYTIIWDTYRDNYFSEDVKRRSRIDCDVCSEAYIIDGSSLLPIDIRKMVAEKRQAVEQLCRTMKEHALRCYQAQMLHCISGMPVAQWHRLWRISSPAIGTFRKEVKRDGVQETFIRQLYGSSLYSVERILVTLKQCDIHDPQLVEWEKEVNKLQQDYEDAQALEKGSLVKSELLKEYRDYSDPH